MILLVLGAVTVQAQTFEVIDVIGYMYESDNDPGVAGFPPSNPGDVLAGVGFVDNFGYTPVWDPTMFEYTWAVDGLVSTGEVDLGNGLVRIFYTGGTIDIIAQNTSDIGYTMPFYGVNPPDAGANATFTDGNIYLTGTFTQFVMTYDTTNHSGNYQGAIQFELGPTFGAEEELLYPDGMTIAGAVGSGADSTIPDGYDMEVDGHVYHDPTIPNEDRTMSQVKNLYR